MLEANFCKFFLVTIVEYPIFPGSRETVPRGRGSAISNGNSLR
jgi:hypothetical protein